MNLDKETLHILADILAKYSDDGIVILTNGNQLSIQDAKISINRLINGRGQYIDLKIYKQLMAWYIMKTMNVGY